MKNYRVIIPANDPAICQNSIDTIRQHQPGARIIVVWDGAGEFDGGEGVEVIPGAKPFGFARNVNIGIRAAGADDVVLWNQDAMLLTPGGLDMLAEDAERFGIVSASIRGRCRPGAQTAQTDQTTPAYGPVSFMAVYISRSTLNMVGLLDENYTIGTWEDDDYCFRAGVAGVSIGVCGACVVLHEHGQTLERREDYGDIFIRNKAYYDRKFGKDRLVLTICIASLHTREAFLARLRENLRPQIGPGVQVLCDADFGNASIGAKRQALLQAARGEYVVFIDDDDLVAPDYIQKIFLAVFRGTNPDCITFDGARYDNGVFDAPVIYSLKKHANATQALSRGRTVYIRMPQHITPIRREIALAVGYKDLNSGEDLDFARRVYPLLKTEERVDGTLYKYFFRGDREEQTNQSLIEYKKHRRGSEVVSMHTTPKKVREYAAKHAKLVDRGDGESARPILSICVCSLESRKDLLDRLMDRLSPQLGNDIELLVDVDAGEVSIGAKRQRLLEKTTGRYIVFIDDDDLVAVDYVERIRKALSDGSRPDCVSFAGKTYIDGRYNCDISYRMAGNDPNKGRFRYHNYGPMHVTPIRREIALAVGFPDENIAEDTAYAKGCESLIKTEIFIPADLYIYDYRSRRDGEQANQTRSENRRYS